MTIFKNFFSFKKLVVFLVAFLIILFGFSQVKAALQTVNLPGGGIWNSAGNVGVGTTAPAAKLDVNGTLGIAGNTVLTLPSNNPEVGPWNPIWNAIGSSKPLYFDEEFASGNNGVSVYNNAGGTGVIITRLTGQTGVPNTTGNVLRCLLYTSPSPR